MEDNKMVDNIQNAFRGMNKELDNLKEFAKGIAVLALLSDWLGLDIVTEDSGALDEIKEVLNNALDEGITESLDDLADCIPSEYDMKEMERVKELLRSPFLRG